MNTPYDLQLIMLLPPKTYAQHRDRLFGVPDDQHRFVLDLLKMGYTVEEAIEKAPEAKQILLSTTMDYDQVMRLYLPAPKPLNTMIKIAIFDGGPLDGQCIAVNKDATVYRVVSPPPVITSKHDFTTPPPAFIDGQGNYHNNSFQEHIYLEDPKVPGNFIYNGATCTDLDQSE